MKISDILKKDECRCSFEVFPPKDGTSFDSVELAVKEIAKLKPSFMSVTYGANGGASEYTLKLAKEIKDSFEVTSLAHLTCVNMTKEKIHGMLDRINDAEIENILALRGDIPDNKSQAEDVVGDYKHAVDLVYALKSYNPNFCIGGACYPEVHPESYNQKDDIKRLKEKVDAGCDFLTTQMFFDNNLLYNFLYKIREADIKVPIVAGIMPITNAKQVERAIKLSGSFMPQRFKSIVDKFGHNPEAMKQAGIAYATDQIIDLYANNVNNIHVYSMNKPDVAKQIMSNLSQIVGNSL